MRNPRWSFRKSFWLRGVLATLRFRREGQGSFNGARGARIARVGGVILCALLAAGIPLVKLAGKRNSKAEGKVASAAATAAVADTASVGVPQKRAHRLAPRTAAWSRDKAQVSENTQATFTQGAAAAPAGQVVLGPPATSGEMEQGEREDSETGRARASWFFDQRAYPFQHIPEGALQKAIEQRDAMKARQRAAGSQSAPNGIISFPGDALWHLMGPQPVNNPFGSNSGSPTASGRVTAIAVDPSDATGNTAYIGGAAGGVWKTTDGGNNWTPLTDFQPSLAVGSIAIDPNNHNIVYVGTGEENFSGDAYYGAGVLKSTDGGATWAQVGASTFAQVLGPQTGGAFIGSIAVQPGNSNNVLAAVSFFVNGTIGGIYRSTDGGNTWTEDAAPQGLAATSVLFESTVVAGNTATAWAAMGDIFGQAVNGVYKSTDSGLTWTKQTGTGANLLPTANLGRITLGYAPSTSGASATIYAAIANSSGSSNDLLGIWKSLDGGANWTQLTGAPSFCNHQCWYDMAVGVHPTLPNTLVAGGGAGPDNFTSLYETTDGGTSWTPAAASPGLPPPAGDFSNGATGVHPHVDTHAVVFTPSGATLRLYIGNDGGVWRTDNPVPGSSTSPTWVDLNAGTASGGPTPGTGLAITQFYPGPSAGISDENYGFGGTQDNDTELFSGSFTWTNLSACGDGGFTAIDPQIPTTVYTTCDKNAGVIVRRSVFNGAVLPGPIRSFNPADSGINHSDRMQFIPPLTLDGGNPNTLYFATCRLYQTTDGAATWNPITGDLSAGNVATTCPAVGGNPTITTMDVAHHVSDIVVAGTSNGKVWESLDATSGIASTWTEIDNGALPPRHVTAVRTQRGDSTGNVVYVTLSGFGSCAGCGATPGHVFVTTNATTAPPTWTDISGDLPDIPVNDIVVSHNDNPVFDAIYIATDVGVFSCPSPTITLCANWTVVGDGLPNSPVLGLAMRDPSRILRAATHGRSMWQIQLIDENPPAVAFLSSISPAAAKVGDPTTQVTITGGNFSTNTRVLFDGVSVGTPTFVSTTQLTISVSSSLLTDGHVFQVSLTDPQGAENGSGPFAVMNPVLSVSTMTPSNTTTYTPVTLHFTGSNFVNSTLVTFNSAPLAGGIPSAGGTVFDVPVPVFLLTVPMPVTVTITNPLPGGGPTPAASFPFTINANPNPVLLVNPTPIFLGPTNLGTTTPVTDVNITNPGGASLTITAQSITGTNSANFAFAPPTSGTSCNFPSSGQSGTGTITLTPGLGCNFGITYTAGTPPGAANSNALLNVTDNAPGSPQQVQIIGVPNVFPVGVTPVNFGPVAIGTTSPTMNTTLFNLTSAPLNVDATGFTITGANKADFQLTTAAPSGNAPCPSVASFVLSANSSCDVGVAFTPSIASNESAAINVSDNGPGSPQSAPLTGIGIEVTSISPAIVATGGPAFTLTVNGGTFAPSAVVNVNGGARLTTFVSSGELLASIPASDIATAGTLAITVTSPNPGGTTSEPKTLFIAQAPPANNDNINFALLHRAGGTTMRTASGPFTGGSTAITLSWSSPFPDTNYTAVCAAEIAPGSNFSLPTITNRTTTSITVIPTNSATPSGILGCMALPDSDTSDIRRGRTVFSGSPTTVNVTWNTAFSTGYTAVCSLESTAASTFTSVISTVTLTSVTVDNSGFASGTMHCMASTSAGNPTLMRRAKIVISNTPTIAVTWGAPFNTFTNDNTDYVAVCSDVEPGVLSTGTALAIVASTKTVSGFTVFNEIASGTLDCLGIPLGGSANSRYTEDTTQTTAQLAAISSPASLATPIDPTPACAPGTATLQGRARSVWQLYIAPENGTVVADTRFSSYPTILSAWTLSAPLPSSSETFTPLACASGNVPAAGASPVQSFVTFNVTKGTSYYLMASDASAAGTGGILTFSIDSQGVAPPNDDNATPITVTPAQLPYSDTVNSVKATPNTNAHNDPTPPCAPGGAANGGQANSVWYTFTPASSGTITADTLTSPYDTILNVTSGSPAGTQVACNDNAAAGIAQSQVSFAAASGTQYFFMVSSVLGDGGTTSFHLNFAAGGVGVPTKLAFTVQPSNVAAGLSISPAVKVAVEDSSGNTVSTATNSITLAFGANPGGGTLSGTNPVSASSGVATFSNLSINKTGTGYTLTASASGLTGTTSIAFNVTAGAAATVAPTSGSGQSTTINTAFGAPLVATVTDSGSNPVSGVVVTFTPPSSGASGTFAGGVNTATTNASGVATSATFTANSTAGGPYNVVASATGATSANFSLTNKAGAAAKVSATSGTPQSAAINTAFAAPLVATVTDSGNNPVSGVVVTFTPPGSGASGAFAGGVNTATTNASGVATSATFTANATAGGPYNVVASATGATSANFSLTNTSGTPTKVTATSGTPQNATINTAFAAPLVATVTDAGNNPVSGVVVTFTPPGSGASGTFAGGVNTATTNASGVATSATFTANATAGGPYNVVASATGATSANFSLTNKAGAAAKVSATSGTPQSATISTAFAAPLVATVTDAGNNPVSGVVVTFTPPGSGASGTFAGGVNTATTNASGVATSATFTANSTAGGPYNVVASATGATSANFALTNLAGPAAKVTATSGTPQSATINTAFAAPLVATVTDSGNNPVSGVVVTFTPPGSGASGTFAGGVNTATTNASGVATSATFTANSTAGGPYNVVASATGATSANFSLTNKAGSAAKVTATSGTPQNATINTAFAAPLVATVTDAGNNPVSGVVVTFTPPGSGASGTFAGGVNTATTNASGVATSTTFTANSTAGGPYNVVASATGATSANFALTNKAGSAAKVAATSGTPQSAAINTAFGAPLVATVTDSGNNPVSGVVVTFTPPGSGASGTFAGGVNTATTNASGVATSAAFTANATAGGPYNVVASATGATSANFVLTNTSGAATKLTATGGTPQSTAINTAFANPFVVTVTDSGNNPVSGVVVTFTPPASGASGAFAGGVNTATSNASGVATSAVFTANGTAGGPYNVVASATGVSSINFAVTNTAGAAAKVSATSGTTQSATINTAFAAPLVATVTDASNNPVSGVVVTFTPPSSGASGTFAGGVNTATTNASGVATSATFTANSTAGGPYNVVAGATGATSANFALTNTAGPAAKVSATSGTPQSASINTAFAAPLVATVTDAGNNPVSGMVVTFTPPASGASGTFAGGVNTATTNASGVATSAAFTANSTVGGPYNVVASATGATSANFVLTNTAGPPVKVAATSGTPQSATINTAFAAPLVVTVTDAGNNPVSGVVVTFTPPSSGASGTFAGGVNTATTNASGVATSATFTANSKAGGAYTVVASVTGATSANFSLTNLTGPATKVTATSGTPQSVAINTAFAAPLVATVTDAGNNPVSGVVVTFTPPASGASGTFAGGINTATTNASGVATSAVFTANSTAGGPYNVVASAAGATSANFALTNTAGAPAKVAATSGTPQSAPINTAFAAPLVATVTDAGNNPVSGVVVTFTPPASGASGTFAGGTNTATTNASGVATSAVFTANSTVGGPYNVVASATGATSANFALTNNSGPPAKVAATSGTPQSATINTAFAAPLVATVTDAGNNPVSGVVVTFTPPASGASGTFAGGVNTATTNASGVATSNTFTANGIAGGPYNVVASATGATSANFALTNKTGPPAKVAATSGTPQSATINTAFAAPLVATVTDAGNNPVSGVVVTFTPPASGASGTFAGGVNTATTNASGVATSNTFTANGTAGGPYNVVASAAGATSANFSLTNNNPVPVITPPLSPASANAGGAAFALTINGTGFVAGATVTFGSNPALTPASITSTQIVVNIPAADIATGGTPNVTVTNPAPGGGPSNAVAFTVNNPTPTISGVNAAGNSHSPGGAAFTLTVNGAKFVSTSVVNFAVSGAPKAEPTTFVSATQITAAIPASDVASAGTASVTVTNPGPGGGTTAAANFTIDGYTVSGPANTNVKAGQQATITITVTPSAQGFANAVMLSVSGLPKHSTAALSQTSLTPGTNTVTSTLTITTTSNGEVPPAPIDSRPTNPTPRILPLMWLAALLVGLYTMRSLRRAPQLRRYAMFVPLALLLISGGVLAGCIGGKSGTPTGPAQLTITATSGTLTQTTNVTLTVQ